MNAKIFFGTTCAALFLALFAGCASPPPPPPPESTIIERHIEVAGPSDTLLPLSAPIIQRLDESHDDLSSNIDRFQILLSGRVSLERERTEKKDEVLEGGKVIFEDVYTREVIYINDQTEGLAIDIDIYNDAIILWVCFENDNTYRLPFKCLVEDIDTWFYLDFEPSVGVNFLSEEKGIVEYGGHRYKLKYTGEKRPYLLIKLSQKDTDRLYSRTVSGRKVN